MRAGRASAHRAGSCVIVDSSCIETF
jgi:hypothetical protein